MYFPVPGINSNLTTQNNLELSKLNSEEFLNILITELNNQNPLEPLKGDKLVSKIMEFSASEKMQNLSKSIDTMQNNPKTQNPYELMGQNVIVSDNSIHKDSEGSLDLNYMLENDATEGLIRVKDANGNLIRELELDPEKLEANKQFACVWNGENSLGTEVSQGEYYYKIIAFDAAGQPISANPISSGVVDGINFVDSSPQIMLDNNFYDFTNILQVF